MLQTLHALFAQRSPALGSRFPFKTVRCPSDGRAVAGVATCAMDGVNGSTEMKAKFVRTWIPRSESVTCPSAPIDHAGVEADPPTAMMHAGAHEPSMEKPAPASP